MSSSYYGIIPAKRRDLTINFIGSLQGVIVESLRNTIVGFNSPKDDNNPLKNRPTKIDIDGDIDAGSTRFIFTIEDQRQVLWVNYTCHIDHTDTLPGHKVIISMSNTSNGRIIINAIMNELGGYIIDSEENSSTVKTNSIKVSASLSGIKEPLEISFDSIVDIFKEELILEKVGIETALWDKYSVSTFYNTRKILVTNVFTRETVAEVCFEDTFNGKKSRKPEWATHTIISKVNPETKRYIKLGENGDFLGGFEINENEFSHNYHKPHWELHSELTATAA